MRARVAQAGWSTATTSALPSTRTGRTCAAELGPASSSQRVKTASIVAGVGARPSRPSSRGIDVADRPRAAVPAAGASSGRQALAPASDPGHRRSPRAAVPPW